ncbi:MAG: O-antigen ligase family protein [Pseudomonadota bacterium]
MAVVNVVLEAPVIATAVWITSWPKWFMYALTSLLMLIFTRTHLCRKSILWNEFDFAILGLSVWMVISSLWSPDKANSLLFFCLLAVCINIYVHLRCLKFEILLEILEKTSILTLIAIAISDFFLPAEVYWSAGNANYVTELVVMLLPIFLYFFFYRKSLWIKIFYILLMIRAGVFLSIDTSSFASAVLGLLPLYYIIFGPTKKHRLYGLSIFSVVLLLAYFFLSQLSVDGFTLGEVKSSIIHRLQIWVSSLYLLVDQPFAFLTGVGLGGYSYYYPSVGLKYYHFFPSLGLPADSKFFNPGQTHNEYLQILVDTGIIGFLLLLVLMFFMLKRINHLDNLKYQAISASVILLLLICLISFPFQRTETMVIIILLFAVVGSMDTNKKTFSFTGKDLIAGLKGFASASSGACLVLTFLATLSWGYFTLLVAAVSQQVTDNITQIAYKSVNHWPLLGSRFDLFHVYIDVHPIDQISTLKRAYIDHLYRLSTGASPYVPNNMITRLYYLFSLNAQINDRPEIEKILDDVEKTYGGLYSWPWSLRAQYALILRKDDEARAYLAKAILAKVIDPDDKFRIEQMKKLLRK